MVLASDLVNLYDEDLGSNMESDTEVNVSNLFLQYKLQNKCESKRFLLLINFHFDANQIFQSISSDSSTCPPIYLNSQPITIVNSDKHLGNLIPPISKIGML